MKKTNRPVLSRPVILLIIIVAVTVGLPELINRFVYPVSEWVQIAGIVIGLTCMVIRKVKYPYKRV